MEIETMKRKSGDSSTRGFESKGETPTRSRYHPWRHLRAIEELTFIQTPNLPSGDAWYDPDRKAIILDSKLSQVGRRWALAHELAHRDLKHRGSQGPDAMRYDERQEKAADLLAARRLIQIEDLIEAARWATDRAELADELWVPVHAVNARLDHLHPSESIKLRAATAHHREDHQ